MDNTESTDSGFHNIQHNDTQQNSVLIVQQN